MQERIKVSEIHVPWAECSLSQKAKASLGETHSTDRMWANSEYESGRGIQGG